MSIKSRIFIVLIIVLIATFSIYYLIDSGISNIERKSIKLKQSSDSLIYIQDIKIDELKYRLNPKQDYLDILEHNIKRLESELKFLNLKEELKLLGSYRDNLKIYLNSKENLGKESLNRDINLLVQKLANLKSSLEAEIFTLEQDLKFKIVATSVVISIIILSILILLGVGISEKLYILRESLNLLSDRGVDLTKKIPVNSKDEISRTYHQINNFISSIESILSDIKTQVRDSRTFAEKLKSKSSKVEIEIESRYNSILEVSTSLDLELKSLESSFEKFTQTELNIGAIEDILREFSLDLSNFSNLIETQRQSDSRFHSQVQDVAIEIKESIRELIDDVNLFAMNLTLELAKERDSSKLKEFTKSVDNLSKQANLSLNLVDDKLAKFKGLTGLFQESKKIEKFSKDFALKSSEILKFTEALTKNSYSTFESSAKAMSSLKEVMQTLKEIVQSSKELESISEELDEFLNLISKLSKELERVKSS